MNILYLINHAGNGGSEKYVLNLASALKNEHKIYFVYNEPGMLCVSMSGIAVKSLRLKMRSAFDVFAAYRLACFAKKHKIDIIHAQYPRENIIAIISRLFYNISSVVYTAHLNIGVGKAWKTVNRVFTRFDSSVISVCSPGKELATENGYPPDKINVIFNGAPKRPYDSDTSKKNTCGPFRFSCLSRLSQDKGLHFLLESVKLLKDSCDASFTVEIAGDGPLGAELRSYAEKLGIDSFVKFPGYRTDTDVLLSESDVCLCSSPMEALSLALVEALSFSVPLVVTAVGGNNDIVNGNTRCGIAVEYNNCKQMAQAMQKMITDKQFYDECRKNAQITFTELFDLETTVEKTYELYKKSARAPL